MLHQCLHVSVIINAIEFYLYVKFKIIVMNDKWECKNCNWEGYGNELDYVPTEGCVGNDKSEICPKCGSSRVFMILT